jgi:DNA-binding transcriptional ArsR family regulator
MIEYLLGQTPLPPLPDKQFIRSVRQHNSAPAEALAAAGGDAAPRLERLRIILDYMTQDAEAAGFAVGDIVQETGMSEKRVENDLVSLQRAGKVYKLIVREHGRRRRLWYAA